MTFQHLPSYILVKLKQTHAKQLEGLNEGVIPIEVSTHSFQIKVRKSNGKYTTSVHHQQLSMTATYGFTNYHSQGQTLPYVIIDSVVRIQNVRVLPKFRIIPTHTAIVRITVLTPWMLASFSITNFMTTDCGLHLYLNTHHLNT